MNSLAAKRPFGRPLRLYPFVHPPPTCSPLFLSSFLSYSPLPSPFLPLVGSVRPVTRARYMLQAFSPPPARSGSSFHANLVDDFVRFARTPRRRSRIDRRSIVKSSTPYLSSTPHQAASSTIYRGVPYGEEAKKKEKMRKCKKYARNAQQSCSTGPEYALNASVRSRWRSNESVAQGRQQEHARECNALNLGLTTHVVQTVTTVVVDSPGGTCD